MFDQLFKNAMQAKRDYNAAKAEHREAYHSELHSNEDDLHKLLDLQIAEKDAGYIAERRLAEYLLSVDELLSAWVVGNAENRNEQKLQGRLPKELQARHGDSHR